MNEQGCKINKKKVLLIGLHHVRKKEGVVVVGGVGNYLSAIVDHYDSNSFEIDLFLTGRRPGKNSNLHYTLSIMSDYAKFIHLLFKNDYALVHLNTSFQVVGTLRDSVYLLIAKLFSTKVLVFWRGWSMRFETMIENNVILLRLFRYIFGKTDAYIVLASSFGDRLRNWGLCQRTFLETTTINDSLLHGFSPVKKMNEIRNHGKLQILFFSRIELAKGIIETIDAFSMIRPKDREITLVIAGAGPDDTLMNRHIKKVDDDRIKVVGYVSGEEKRMVLETSHILCLPTTYGEGLPNAIIEAMAFGLTIITTPVGGIPDIVTEGENGYYVRSVDRDSISTALRNAISDREEMIRIAMNNYNTARERFLASIVAKRIDNIYGIVVNQ